MQSFGDIAIAHSYQKFYREYTQINDLTHLPCLLSSKEKQNKRKIITINNVRNYPKYIIL